METLDSDSNNKPIQTLISDLLPGQRFTGFFMLRKKELRTKKESSELYLSLELGDASGRIWGSVWQNVQESYKAITVGKPVKILATAIEYKDKLHLNVDKVRPAHAEDRIDMRQFIPTGSQDPEAMYSRLIEKVNTINNNHLRQLLKDIFTASDFKNNFSRAPGGKLWHHAYIGGLLEHTLAVTSIAEMVAGLYHGINLDMLLAGAMLHDIGKVKEYRVDGVIDFSDEGRLHGHITIGYHIVAECIDRIEDFPKALRDELLHLILSHQGSRENASPVVPMTPEAMILYYADELDSKVNALQRIIRKEKNSDRHWSAFVPLLERFIYFGSKMDFDSEEGDTT